MSLRKPRTIGQWLLLISPALLIIVSVALGFAAERALPRGGHTALLATMIGLVPALILSIAIGCWLLEVEAKDEYGRSVQGGFLGLGVLVANFVLAIPALILVRQFML